MRMFALGASLCQCYTDREIKWGPLRLYEILSHCGMIQTTQHFQFQTRSRSCMRQRLSMGESRHSRDRFRLQITHSLSFVFPKKALYSFLTRSTHDDISEMPLRIEQTN